MQTQGGLKVIPGVQFEQANRGVCRLKRGWWLKIMVLINNNKLYKLCLIIVGWVALDNLLTGDEASDQAGNCLPG